MDFPVEWWHWVVLGCALLAADALLINVYYLIWFGIGAMIIGLVLTIFPQMSFGVQLILWGVLSSLLLVQWLFWLRPVFSRKRAAEARSLLPGQAGSVVHFSNGAGELQLQRPVGGRDRWSFRSATNHKPGDRVVVGAVDAEGNVITKEEE
ncbi:MAG: NfeD family protein [Gammaproteobacteria bacterium]